MGPSSAGTRRRVAAWACAGATLVAVACDGSGGGVYVLPDGSATLTGPDGGPLPGKGVGQACSVADVCRSGLSCNAGTCAPCGCSSVAAECVISDECGAGLSCGAARTCVAGGSGAVGDACVSDASCGRGLRCDLVGLSADCQPEGASDVGGACSSGGDCLAGLGCASTSPAASSDGGALACQPYPPSPNGVAPIAIPSWTGETCNDPTGPTQAYFRVPRGTDDGDFYRLPFPNDVRLTAGKIDLTGHPTPGAALLGYDLVQRWLTDLSTTADGFSTYPTVFFRFSAQVDQGNTLKSAGAIRWVDVTQPATPIDVAFAWTTTTDRNAYICNNWIGLRPSPGQPLTPGHTYAVILSTVILDGQRQPIQASPDLTALLAASAPADPTLAAQWPKYQPLRGWATQANVAPSAILDATVFTVGHPALLATMLPAAVAAAQPPPATQWIRCGTAPSPCPQATGDRACGTPDPAFDELQALVPLPIFQEGTPPYASDGGDIALGADGTPQVQRYEAVCMALTVPKGVAMPAGGWPLLVYAHGTGGSYRSAITEGVAGREAAIDDGAGGNYHVAVLGIDQVEHGPRRGASQDSPDNLFYNFANPKVARGNPMQGAADQMSLVRFASALNLTAAQSPTGAAIKFGNIAFWGHSQGATEGGIAMPYTAGVRGAVLSGEGASVIDGLLGKKNPVDIADVLPVALEEDPSKMGVYHPVLALLQNDLDGVDPLNHASALVFGPTSAAVQKHVFQPYGQGDTYAPPTTEQTFAIAARLTEVAPGGGATGTTPVAGVPLPAPLGGNASVLGMLLTAVVRQYAPDATYDGHFVVYDNAAAEADVDHFVGDALAGKAPKVGR
ncbi:MAG TPA: hypothetical protein VH044_03975 [Polyangiaceae bacterium]|jgi:hypothetical protein|nr:hypothetical protein [Polyangiaceae bacterium]